MKSTKSTPDAGLYDMVFIIGPDFSEEKIAETIQAACTHKTSEVDSFSYLIIGNGKDYVSENELKSLKGRIGPGTQIHLMAHGTVQNKKHIIQLLNEQKLMHTSGVFDILAQCAVDAPTASPLNGMQLSLKSCYGGMSVLDGERLPHYCALIIHGGKEYPTSTQRNIDGIVHSIKTQDPSRTVLSNFAEDWRTTPETHTLLLGHSKQTISMRAPHKHPLATADAVKLYLENTQTSTYLDWCKKLPVSTPQEENIIKQSVDYLAEKKVSDPEAHTYLANLDVFHCYIRKRPLIDFLDKTGRHPDQVNLNNASLLAIFSDNGFIQDRSEERV